MTPEHARKLLAPYADQVTLTATSTVGRYGGAWIITARLGDYERVITQTSEPWTASRWIRRYEELGEQT